MTDQEKKNYIARFGDQTNVSRLVRHPADLQGAGTEYLVVEGQLQEKYVDGALVKNMRPRPLKSLKAL